MPDFTVTHIALFAIMTVIGAVAGWVLRGNRAEQEKSAVSAGWQEQIDAQRKEAGRLLEQNKSLMEQVSQYQASNADAKNRARELSSALQEAFERRDELQREIKDIRNNLEVTLSQRDQLQSDMAARGGDEDLLRQKDERIEKLARELENWQNRLPPLIERYRIRNEEAEQLEIELEAAREQIQMLESEQAASAETRIEPVRDPDELTDGLDASNDPVEDYVDEYDADEEEDLLADDEILDTSDEEEELLADDEIPDAWDEEGELLADDEVLDASEEPAHEPEPEAEPEPESDHEPADGHEPEPEPDALQERDGLDDRDDLKMIKGVGPAIEKTLNELGIFSFRQIADMSEYDIDRVARKLKGFHSRIYREDWIGQARALLDQAAHA